MRQFITDGDWNLFLSLLRAGLWEQPVILSKLASQGRWERMLELARRQAVTGLLLRGITHLPADQLPPAPVRMQLLAEANEIEQLNLQMNIVERELRDFFEQHGLRMLVLKGSQAARHYEVPLLRQCGDIDIYFPDGKIEEASALVDKAERAPDGSTVFNRKGICIEIHPRYFDLHLPDERLPAVPSACGEIVLYSAHILKHALGVGIGLKQFCDLARALAMLEGRYDKQELEEALRKAGILRWHQMLCAMLVGELGLNPKYCLDSFKPCSYRNLLQNVRRGGNFGTSRTSRKLAVKKAGWRRKLSTATSFIARLPFSLRYAPRETWATLRELAHGNLFR